MPQNLQRRDASISHSRSGPLGGRRWLGGLAHGRVAVEVSARAGGRRVVCAVPKKEASEGTNERGVAPSSRGIGRKSAVSVTASLAEPRRWLVGEPDFRRLWLVGLVVFSVRWLEMLAVAVFAYQHTGSPLIVALLTMLRMLPMALFGALIGAAAERVERRTALVLVVLTMLLSSVVLALLAWSGALEVWHLALASFISGITWTTDNPVRRTMIGEVVGHERMGAAMSLDVGANNASRMLGPIVGGILLATLGIGGAFAVSVAGYLAAFVVALRIQHRNTAAPSIGAGVIERMIEGLMLVRRDPSIERNHGRHRDLQYFRMAVHQHDPGDRPGQPGSWRRGDRRARQHGRGRRLLRRHRDRPFRQAAALCTALYRRGRDLFGDGAGLRAGVLSGARRLRAAADGFGQCRVQHHAGDIGLPGRPPEMRSRVYGVLSVCIGVGMIGFLHLGWLAGLIGAAGAIVTIGIEGLAALLLTRRWWRAVGT